MRRCKNTFILMACMFVPVIPMTITGMDIDDFPVHLAGCIGIAVCWCGALMLSDGKMRRTILCALFAISIIPYLINIGWFAISKEMLHNNQYWVIFDSNIPEMAGFMQLVPKYVYLLIAITIALLSLLLTRAMHEEGTPLKIKSRKPELARALCIMLIVMPILIPTTRRRGTPINFYSSFKGYLADIRQMKEFMQDRPNLEGRVHRADNGERNTIIVVIGESFNRNHSSLYGYERETNPMLGQIKDSLMIFRNVTSPDYLTQVCLTDMLTFPDSIKVTRTEKAPTLIELLKAAGYKTYWIDNQGKRGNSDTFIPTSYRVLAAQADYFFVNPNGLQDETLLPKMEQILTTDSTKDKVIFMHLMGSHFPYNKRVPEKFGTKFKSKETPSQFNLDEKQARNYNTYDNTLVYNDYVVYQIFRQSFALNGNHAVIYLSDHGEEVYDEFEFAGRSNKYISHNLYDVPFLVHLSERYRTELGVGPQSGQDVLGKCYNSGLLEFTVLQLCGIKTDCEWKKWSIFHKTR